MLRRRCLLVNFQKKIKNSLFIEHLQVTSSEDFEKFLRRFYFYSLFYVKKHQMFISEAYKTKDYIKLYFLIRFP